MAAKRLSGDAIEAVLAAQGIALAPGRGERLAQGLHASIGPSLDEAAQSELEFEREPCGFALALERCKAR